MRFLVAVCWTILTPTAVFAAIGDNSVGMNVHNGPISFLDACVELDVGWVRMGHDWRVIEDEQDAYRWQLLDQSVQYAIDQGLRIYMGSPYTPDWVPRHGDTDGRAGNDPPDDSTHWVDFLTDLVNRYRPMGVTHYGIWNEPNLREFWEGTRQEYIDTILIPGAAAIRAACNDCLVLGPDLAHVSDYDVWLEDIMTQAPGSFDILAHHSYHGFPELGQTIFDGDRYFEALDQQRPFSRRDLKQVLDLVGYDGEVWITETGHQANPVNAQSEADQALFLTLVLREQLARPWYTNTFFYEINDCGPIVPNCCCTGYGLMWPNTADLGAATFPADFRIKAGFDELKRYLEEHPEIEGIPGPARPAIEAHPTAAITIDGVVDDFGDAGWVTLENPNWVEASPAPFELRRVRAAARWDTAHLYLAFEVTDDVHHPGAPIWQGDSVQVAFDVGRNGGSPYDDTDDHELAFAGVGGMAVTERYHGPPGADTSVVAALARDGVTTTYEARIARPALPSAAFTSGTAVGFSFLVNDADGAERLGWIELTPGIGSGKTPETFSTLTFVGTPIAGDGAGPLDGAQSPGDAALSGADAAMSSGDKHLAADNGQSGLDGAVNPVDADGCACGGTPAAPWLLAVCALLLRRRRSG